MIKSNGKSSNAARPINPASIRSKVFRHCSSNWRLPKSDTFLVLLFADLSIRHLLPQICALRRLRRQEHQNNN